MDKSFNIEKAVSEYEKIAKIDANYLKQAPGGSLLIINGAKGPEYIQVVYVNGVKKRTRISNNEKLIYKLANKAYIKEQLKNIEYNLKILNGKHKIKPISGDGILKELPKNYEILNQYWIEDLKQMNRDVRGSAKHGPNPVSSGKVRPVNMTETLDELFPYHGDLNMERITADDWARMEYCENTKYIEHKIHTASNGLKTRSKSESIIMDIYINKGIPFHYDETIKIDNKLISPDFISLRDDGSFLIHEHAGLWSEEYVERMLEKIRIYAHAGFMLGKNLLITYDEPNGGINTNLISIEIEHMYEM